MDRILSEFVSALRKSELDVSPAETLDAIRTLKIVGIHDRALLKESLAVVLAKTSQEKDSFEQCFNRFFSFSSFSNFTTENKLTSLEAREQGSKEGEREEETTEEKSNETKTERPRAMGNTSLFAADSDQQRELNALLRMLPRRQSLLTDLMLKGDQPSLLMLMIRSAEAVHLERMKTLRERSIYSKRILLRMGMTGFEADMERLNASPDSSVRNLVPMLEDARRYLKDQIRNYVDEQYLLLVDGTGNRFLREAVSNTKLTAMQTYYFDHIRDAVIRLARKLIKKHAQQKKVRSRGRLDLRKTLRRNLAFDGMLFDLRWRKVKKEAPRIFVLCDVSGSVKNVSRFLLTFLYSLNELLPHVRSFAFSNELGEVTDFFSHYPLNDAVDMILDDYGKGSTDYGQAFSSFNNKYLENVDSRSTVIILGDGRNNYFYSGVKEFSQIARRCRQLVWLNPESKDQWREGDAEMSAYLPHCSFAAVCNSLDDLEKLADRMLEFAV